MTAPEPPEQPTPTPLGPQDQPAVRLTLLDRLIIPIVTALLATIAAVAGAYIGATTANKGAANAQRAEFAEQRAKEARDRRADKYFAFLKAADAFHEQAHVFKGCLGRAKVVGVADAQTVEANCPSESRAFYDARAAYMAAQNDVQVFGSDDAVQAAKKVEETLPQRLGWDLVTGNVSVLLSYNSPEYVAKYDEFTKVMCREVPPAPRTDC